MAVGLVPVPDASRGASTKFSSLLSCGGSVGPGVGLGVGSSVGPGVGFGVGPGMGSGVEPGVGSLIGGFQSGTRCGIGGRSRSRIIGRVVDIIGGCHQTRIQLSGARIVQNHIVRKTLIIGTTGIRIAGRKSGITIARIRDRPSTILLTIIQRGIIG
mmetsp:Transcript_33149/g.33619  ORF Transcript_33149/g.33619 Transcript_33149/m.33619 type:complete len:157 (-) Transcript_33149:524-994(-)